MKDLATYLLHHVPGTWYSLGMTSSNALDLGSRCVLRPDTNPALCVIVGVTGNHREWIVEITGPRNTDYARRQLINVPVGCEDLVAR